MKVVDTSIKGIQTGRGPNGELPIRREIDEWWFSKDLNDLNQRSLFIYALAELQKKGLTNLSPPDDSYFSIAGKMKTHRWLCICKLMAL